MLSQFLIHNYYFVLFSISVPKVRPCRVTDCEEEEWVHQLLCRVSVDGIIHDIIMHQGTHSFARHNTKLSKEEKYEPQLKTCRCHCQDHRGSRDVCCLCLQLFYQHSSFRVPQEPLPLLVRGDSKRELTWQPWLTYDQEHEEAPSCKRDIRLPNNWQCSCPKMEEQ